MDATIRDVLGPIHRSDGTAWTHHAVGEGGLMIEGSKHWEYAYVIRQSQRTLRHARALVMSSGRADAVDRSG
jgi:hypothetical protein